MQTLCRRCGAPIRKAYAGRNKAGAAVYRSVSMLGNPHDCPRGGKVAKLLDRGKNPYAEIRRETIDASRKRVENNNNKGIKT